jgi:anti-sigma factor ChrR (cupin superfamily)
MPEATLRLFEGGWRGLPFEPFRDGVEIAWIRRFSGDEPGVAILKYRPGASVPRHRHEGVETILVLEGEQIDEAGAYSEGAFVVNATGSEHSVWSPKGCAVLIQWQRPVKILAESNS